MAFLYYDIAFLIIFTVFVVAFLIRNKKNLKLESRILLLYRTKVGLKLINYLGSRNKKFLNFLSYVVLITGYILMITAVWMFFELAWRIVRFPEIIKIAKIPPIVPLIPYLPQIFKVDFLPPFYFTYWIISIAIIAVFHELAHGVFARFYKVNIKSTGFGFLGPFLAAFVEPDEKQLAKRSKREQITVLAAGSFANVVITIIFAGIMLAFYALLFEPGAVVFNEFAVSTINISTITKIGWSDFSSPSMQNIEDFLKDAQAEDYVDITVRTNYETVNLTKIEAGNKTYFTLLSSIGKRIQNLKALNITEENAVIRAFYDAPAIRNGILAPIKSINSVEVRSREDINYELQKYKPYDKVSLEVIQNNYTVKNYEVTLAEHPAHEGEAFLGIGFSEVNPDTRGLFGFFTRIVLKMHDSFRERNVFYVPNGNSELIIFMYDMILWIVLINISVAIVNMLPLGIFDGGRAFLLTVWALTNSKEKAEKSFKFVSFVLLLLLLIIMIVWFTA